MKNSIRCGVAALITTLALGGLAGCGGNDNATSSSSGSASSAASKVAPKATKASFPYKEGTIDAKDLVSRIGAAQKKLKSYHSEGTVAMANDGQSATIKVVGDTDMSDPDKPLTHSTITGAGQNMETVSDGTTTWVKTGGKWVSSDSAQNGGYNQAMALSQLADAATSAQYKGKDSQGHHFVLQLDGTKMAGASSGASSLGTVPAEYWTDDDLTPTKTKMTITSAGIKSTSEMTMSKFNEPVTIPKVK